MRKLLLIVSTASVLFSGCSSCSSEKEPAYPLNEVSLFQEIDNELKSNKDTLLYTLISDSTYIPFLTKKDGLLAIDSIQKLLSTVEQHGFEGYLAEDIEHINLLKSQVDSVFVLNADTASHSILAKLEIATLKAGIKYKKAMEYGTVDPTTVFKTGYHLPYIAPDSLFVENFIKADNKLELITNAYPSDPKYKPLQEAYQKALASKADDEKFIKLPALSVSKLEPGKKYKDIPLLRQRLLLPERIDSINGQAVQSREYDSLTVNAVKKFQKNNALKDDGVVGPATIAVLNRSPQDVRDQMRATLERFRWQLNTNKENYVWVNIPDYHVTVFKNKKPIHKQIVVVGKKHPKSYYKYTASNRPNYVRNHETPEFMDTLEMAVLNPKWNVPKSISTLEILPNVQANPNYLIEHNYRVYSGGQEVPRDSVNWLDFNASTFPFRVVQDPGYGNALGRIKFLFPNRFSVYLHDTPSKSYFYRDYRAVSHGCVRVKEPFELGKMILTAQGVKTMEKFKNTDEYKIIYTDEGLQVIITYYTTWVDENGELQIRADVYDKDAELLEFLKPKENDQLIAAAS